jgi:Mlc titration factor MtfA (ptsG expression regulator)
MQTLWLVGGSAALAAVFAVSLPILRARRRRRLMRTPLPAAWEEILRGNVGLYSLLPDDLRRELHGRVQVFLDEKHFEGCGGLEMTDEIRLAIAAQACFLLLNRPTARCYPRLRSILVYPHAYVAPERYPIGWGVYIEELSERLGESWSGGTVVFAWDSVAGGVRNIRDGQNVVLHEFAHQLDQEDGSADGAPILAHRSGYATWAGVLQREYDALRASARRGRRSVLDDYGATDPAEFFAVATEAFFEKPAQLLRKHPALYDELRSYYRLDPAVWIKSRNR